MSVLGFKGHFLCLLCISFLILFLQAMGQFEQMSSRNYIQINGVKFHRVTSLMPNVIERVFTIDHANWWPF